MKKVALFVVLVVIVVVGIPALHPALAQDQSKPIKIGYSAWPGWWPWVIAEKEGMFKANGIDVQLVWFDDYTQSMEAFAGGDLDGCAQTLNDTITFMGAAHDNGFDEVAVLVNDNSAGNDKIIATKDIKTVDDLIGKKVAIEVGVVDDFLLSLALKDAGHSRSDVQIVNLSTGDAAAAFYAGKADAVGAFPPFWETALQRDGAHELLSSAQYPGAIPDLLVLKSTLIKDNPKAVQALVKTWWDITQFIKDHPDKALAELTDRAGVSQDDFNLFQKGTKFFTVQDNLEAFSDGNSMVNMPYAKNQMAQFMLDVGLIKTIPDMSGLLDDSFIKSYAQSVGVSLSTAEPTAAATGASTTVATGVAAAASTASH